MDSSTIREVDSGEETDPNTSNRGRPGSNHHFLVDDHEVPLEVQLHADNKINVMQLVPFL